MLRCWNCHSINRMIFVSAHGQAACSSVAETQIKLWPLLRFLFNGMT
jgi:hypothetical protein